MSAPAGRREAIRAVYLQVDAPEWAALNLDALADVLRDLSWRAPGEVRIATPREARVRAVVEHAVETSGDSVRPIVLT